MNRIFLMAAGLLVSLPAFAVVPVPEPGSMSLLGLGLAGVVASRLLRK